MDKFDTLDWLKSNADMFEIERNVQSQHIWIISPNLYHDRMRPETQRVVRENLEKGVSYTYIIPNSNEANAALPAMHQLFGPPYENQLRIRSIPEDEFNRLAPTHTAIYNPHIENNQPPHVFIELPIKGRGYWVEVTDERDAWLFIDRFRRLVEGDS